MRAAWLDRDASGRGVRALRALLVPVSWCYAFGAWLYRAAHRHGLRRTERLPCRVVSVGSLAAGGAGKTPAAAWLAAGLHARGHRVALLSRGHGRRRGHDVVIVSDGRRVRARLVDAGDEPLLLAGHVPGVPVVVGRDRVRAGRRALATFGAELLVLDDGFQHFALHRDVDLVLLDGDAAGPARCLPAGPLREPWSGLARADAIGRVDGASRPGEDDALAAVAPKAWRFTARRRAVSLRQLGESRRVAPETLRDREVAMLCGIAQPAALRRTLEALGAQVNVERRFPDHHRYTRADVADLAAHAPLWVTTEKDALKLPAAWVGDADVRVLEIAFEPDDPAALLDWIEARLR